MNDPPLSTDMPMLLAADEPQAVDVLRAQGRSPFFLICDHASARLPRSLGSLGLPPQALQRHIAWDIGAAGVARALSEMLDATLIEQCYSRLAIDCNRPLTSAESIPVLSEDTAIAGNAALGACDAARRAQEIFMPYHERIAATLDRRQQRGQPSLLVAVHSFTPVYLGVARPWHIGLLYHRDPRVARRLLEVLRADAELVVGDNEPYAVGDDTDYSLPVHGEKRSLPHVGIEIRQDLIADAAGQRQWAQRLAQAFRSIVIPLAST